MHIEWVEVPDVKNTIPIGVFGPERTACVELDLAKLDEVWRQDPFDYIGPGGMGEKPQKTRGVADWLKSNRVLWMPVLYSPSNDPYKFLFEDGRHRTAYLRDSGVRRAMFTVPEDQAASFRAIFG